jgi:hypothetical protein
VRALVDGVVDKAGVLVPSVCGAGSAYPRWVHPYDNYWINKVSPYLFPRASVEWPIRLFAAYQSPLGEIGGGVYDVPREGWGEAWEAAGGPKKWQPHVARPLADLAAEAADDPDRIHYGLYVRDHLFVLQVYDLWRATGWMPFLIEMYHPCRRALKYLESRRDTDGNGLIETTCVLSDVVVEGDEDIHSTERAEDQVMLFGALRAFAHMAEALGGTRDAAWARGWSDRIQEELFDLMWREEGRLIFGVDRVTKAPRLEYVTTTYGNGYAILFGMTDPNQTAAILDFMGRQRFVVPGPYHIPPVRQEDGPRHAPGVYCNGGCGWGRGIVPSVALACFEQGRHAQGLDYLKRQSSAARRAGSFHEYWTWEEYAGETKPGGAPWYCETSAGFLDALLHGLFGLSVDGRAGSARLEPRLPENWDSTVLEIRLPTGDTLRTAWRREGDTCSCEVAAAGIVVEVVLPTRGPVSGAPEGEVRVERTPAKDLTVVRLTRPGRLAWRRTL